MTQHHDTGHWLWTEQQFLRIAVVPANADVAKSSWGFRDVLVQNFTAYDFHAGKGQSFNSAERRAMRLSDVTDNAVYVNDTKALLSDAGCGSTIRLERFDVSMIWTTLDCPKRVRFGDTIISTANAKFDNGVGWVSHAYGQLPTLGGAVIIDQFEVQLSNNQTLQVNRSRRRSGSGPVTVAADLFVDGNTQSLRDVSWANEFNNDALFPSNIRIDVPSMSLVLSVDVPSNMPFGFFGSDVGVQHGVLVSTNDAVLPGVVTLQPRSLEAL